MEQKINSLPNFLNEMDPCLSIMGGKSNYWERLKREKDVHLFAPKADIKQSFCTERNFQPHSRRQY